MGIPSVRQKIPINDMFVGILVSRMDVVPRTVNKKVSNF